MRVRCNVCNTYLNVQIFVRINWFRRVLVHLCAITVSQGKDYVFYEILDIYENPKRRNFINPSLPSILEWLIGIKNDIIFIFTLLWGVSGRFHLFEAPKRSVKIKKLCHFSLFLFHWDNKGLDCILLNSLLMPFPFP